METPRIVYSIRVGRQLLSLGEMSRKEALRHLRAYRQSNRVNAVLHEEQAQ